MSNDFNNDYAGDGDADSDDNELRASNYTTDNIFVMQCLVQKYLGRAGGRFYTFVCRLLQGFPLGRSEKSCGTSMYSQKTVATVI